MKQERTSANTSINKNKLPAAFQKYRPHGHVCDYGCGKYTHHIREYVDYSGALSYNPYDPYNKDAFINDCTERFAAYHGYDMIYCCNVLNVIDSDDEIIKILADLFRWTRETGQIIIQIYEGNKSGTGRETKFDCYQRNMKTIDYLQYITDPAILNHWRFRWELSSNFIRICKYR